jgi:hypothetical protein
MNDQPLNQMSRDALLVHIYHQRDRIARLESVLLTALAHLEGRSDMSTDGNWEPLLIDLIRRNVGWDQAVRPASERNQP